MDYFDGSVYTVRVYDENGNPVKAGEIVTVKLNKKTYKIKLVLKG